MKGLFLTNCNGHLGTNLFTVLPRYALQFFKETNEEIQLRKEQARQSIESVCDDELEIDTDNYFLPELDFPKRPVWAYEMTKEELDMQENRYFRVNIIN